VAGVHVFVFLLLAFLQLLGSLCCCAYAVVDIP
jgi:hypothetical protein